MQGHILSLTGYVQGVQVKTFYTCPPIGIRFLAVTDMYAPTEEINLQKRNDIFLLNVNNPYGNQMVIYHLA